MQNYNLGSLGPYRISEEKTANTFKLVLPKSMGRLHPVFHRELLWKDIPVLEELENRMELDDPPLDIQMEQEDLLGTTGGVQMDIMEEMSDEDIEDLEEDTSAPPVIPFLNAQGNEYIPVERLVDRRDKGESHEYLVKFVGFPDVENVWEHRDTLMKGSQSTKQLVRAYDKQAKGKIRKTKNGNTSSKIRKDLQDTEEFWNSDR